MGETVGTLAQSQETSYTSSHYTILQLHALTGKEKASFTLKSFKNILEEAMKIIFLYFLPLST